VDNKKIQNFWSIYIGDALTDSSVPPATIVVTETFHKSLLSINHGAWNILIRESEKFMEERKYGEDSIY